MNGASPRPDSRCSSRASSSLPVPLSPRISTVADSLRHLLHEIDDVADLAARADQELALALLGDLRAQRDDLAVQILPLAGVAHQRPQLVVVEVLGDVVVGAVLHRLHGRLDLVDGRDHDALDEAVVLLDDAQDVEAADAGQPDVEQDQVDVLVFEQRQRRLAARHRQDAVVALEDGGDRVPHPLIVVADQDGLRGRPWRRLPIVARFARAAPRLCAFGRFFVR